MHDSQTSRGLLVTVSPMKPWSAPTLEQVAGPHDVAGGPRPDIRENGAKFIDVMPIPLS
jgi:hypothetical protein